VNVTGVEGAVAGAAAAENAFENKIASTRTIVSARQVLFWCMGVPPERFEKFGIVKSAAIKCYVNIPWLIEARYYDEINHLLQSTIS
jgi:hypothetical protein